MKNKLAIVYIILATTLIGASPNHAAVVIKSKTKATASSWTATVGYESKVDLAEQVEEKTYRHMIDLELDFTFNKWLYYANSGMSYYSQGREVPVENDNPSYEDVEFGSSYRETVFENNKLSTGLKVSLPTGTSSVYEAYNGIYTGSISLSTPLYSKMTLTNSLRLGYISNVYYYSQVTNKVNPEWASTYSLGLNTELAQKLYFGLSASIKGTQDLDGHQFASTSQTASISYTIAAINMSLRYTNGNYFDEGPSRYWAFDQYRKNVTARFEYAF